VLTTIAFYLFATVAVAAGFMVVAARNPVHSVMWLILTFFSAAGLFVLMGAEFIALLLVMVYVGAVAVLFLFVVMMLDVDFVEMKQGFLQYLPIGALVAVILLIEMFFVGAAYFTGEKSAQLPERTSELSNLEQFGAVLYTDYAFFFEAAGPERSRTNGTHKRAGGRARRYRTRPRRGLGTGYGHRSFTLPRRSGDPFHHWCFRDFRES